MEDATVAEAGAPRMRMLRAAYQQFIARPEPGRDWVAVVWWWDSRRLVYSLLVLATALVSTVVVALYSLGVAALGGFGIDVPGWASPLVLIFWPAFLMCMGNAWYTGGWVAELALRLVIKDRMLWIGVAMLAVGVVFSIVFTILITIALTGVWS